MSRIAIAGNHALDPSVVAMHLLRQLAELPIDTTVLLRRPLSGHPGPVEALTEQLAGALSIQVEWRQPKRLGGGGLATINRDLDMVDDADLVIAYFHPDHVMSEDRGTTRLVRHAIATNTPVNAFTPTMDEMLLVGSIEEESHASPR